MPIPAPKFPRFDSESHLNVYEINRFLRIITNIFSNTMDVSLVIDEMRQMQM